MKNTILVLFLVFAMSNLSAQGTVKLKLTLKDMKMSPLSFTKIKLVETGSGDSLIQKTKTKSVPAEPVFLRQAIQHKVQHLFIFLIARILKNY